MNPFNPLPTPPKQPSTYRCSFTLPVQLATDLNRVAKRLHVSQSALLAELLTEPIAGLCKLMDQVPPGDEQNPSAEVKRRLRAQSADLIRDVVRHALEAARSIDPELPL